MFQLELHATPDAAQVDRHDLVIVLNRRIGDFRQFVLDTGVVERCVQTAKSGDGLLDHGFGLIHVRYVATNPDGAMTFGDQSLGSRLRGFAVDVGQCYSGTCTGKGLRGCQTDTGRSAGHQRDLVFE
ncbi:hypothetical protein D9M73_217140 [compost metagenome]